MASFDDAFDLLIGNEGGYVNNPADPGGETMFGITARVARAWGYQGSMRDLPRNTAKRIAKQLYWDPLHADDFDSRVGFQLFDAQYNGGHVVLWMQQASGVRAHGVLDQATIDAVKATDAHVFIMRFIAARQAYLTACKPWPSFGKGWINRTSRNLLIGAR